MTDKQLYEKWTRENGSITFRHTDRPDPNCAFTKETTPSGKEIYIPHEFHSDPSEEPVLWDDIAGPLDNGVMGSPNWLTFGDDTLRSYEGSLYIEHKNDEWMELESWIRAVAEGELK